MRIRPCVASKTSESVRPSSQLSASTRMSASNTASEYACAGDSTEPSMRGASSHRYRIAGTAAAATSG